MNEFFVWFFSSEHLLLLMSKCCLGISIFLAIDVILQSSLLGFNLKEKWINFLNNEYSIYVIVILGFLFYLFFNYPFEFFDVAFAASEEELAKATIEASNVKISNIDQAIRYGSEAGVFITLAVSTSKLTKTSFLPLGGKIAVSVGGGIIGLGAFKLFQSNTSYTRPQSRIIIQADNVKSSVSISSTEAEKLINSTKDKSFPAKSMLDPTNNIGDKDFYIIAKEGVEVLSWDLFIHLGLIILIINAIIFLTMKCLSEYDIKLDFVKKLPFGNNIYLVLNKLKDLWSKTTIVWIFISLFFILIGTLFSAWGIYDVINKLG